MSRPMMPLGPQVAPVPPVVEVVVVTGVVVVEPCVVELVVVVGDVLVVVVPCGAVVVVAPPAPSAVTRAVTNPSTVNPSGPVSSWVGQPPLASSFSKQPFAGSRPPSNLSVALSMHPLSFAGTPFCSDFCQHLSTPTSLDETHFFLPAEHLFTTVSGNAGSTARTTPSTKPSAMVSKVSLSLKVRHGVSEPGGYFASSFAKHPFSGFVGPPSYFAITFVRQSLASGETPFCSAVA